MGVVPQMFTRMRADSERSSTSRPIDSTCPRHAAKCHRCTRIETGDAALEDFAPVSHVVSSEFALIVPQTVPATNLKEYPSTGNAQENTENFVAGAKSATAVVEWTSFWLFPWSTRRLRMKRWSAAVASESMSSNSFRQPLVRTF